MTATRVLFLASDLGPCGAARQLALLAPRLAAEGFAVRVAALGRADTPFAREIQAGGVTVDPVPLRHAFDTRGWRVLRELVAGFVPDVVHAWGPLAVRAARGIGAPVVASAASGREPGWRGWITPGLLARCDRVLAGSWADADRYRALGVCGDDLTRIPPAVAPAPPSPDRAAALKELGLPGSARVLLTAGSLEPSPGLKAAIWAFDMLRYDRPELHLVVPGGGPDRAGLEAFGRALAFDDFRVLFPGPRPDLPALVGLADVVWVLQEQGGVNLALEAMAAGRPVVGWANPDLAEVVDDGATGRLVGVGEKAQVSAATYGLLADPAAADRLGASGQARAADRFGADRMAAAYARVYHELPRRSAGASS